VSFPAALALPASVVSVTKAANAYAESVKRAGELFLNAYKRTSRYAREKLHEGLAALGVPRGLLISAGEASELTTEPAPLPSPPMERCGATIHAPNSPPTHPSYLKPGELGYFT